MKTYVHIRMIDAPPRLTVAQAKAAVDKVYAERRAARAAQQKAQEKNKNRLPN